MFGWGLFLGRGLFCGCVFKLGWVSCFGGGLCCGCNSCFEWEMRFE